MTVTKGDQMLVWLSRISPQYVEIVQSMIDVNVCKTTYSSQMSCSHPLAAYQHPDLYDVGNQIA